MAANIIYTHGSIFHIEYVTYDQINVLAAGTYDDTQNLVRAGTFLGGMNFCNGFLSARVLTAQLLIPGAPSSLPEFGVACQSCRCRCVNDHSGAQDMKAWGIMFIRG